MEIIHNATFSVLEVTPLGARLQGKWADLWSALQAACVMETQGYLEISGYVSGDGYVSVARYVLEAGAVQGLLAPGESLSRPPRKGRMALIREGMRCTRVQNPLADEILQPDFGMEDDCGV